MVYNIISAICIAIMVILLVCLVVKFCMCNRAEKIEFIKNFKKGKCVIIYAVAVPLFLMSDLYSGKSIGTALFNSISKAVQLVVLKYDTALALAEENSLFAVTLYMCLTLVIVNAMMITISILNQSIWKKYRLFMFSVAKGNKCMVIGNNAKVSAVYDSCTCTKLYVAPMNREEKAKLYVRGVSYQSYTREDRLRDWLEREIKKYSKRFSSTNRKLNIVIHCENEQDNLNWCGAFLKIMNNVGDSVMDNVEVYVFGNREFEDIYSKYEEKSKGCLHYVNEYRQIAVDFIDRYPLTEFMNSKHIDYDNALLKPETEINVTMVGFGRTNKQIFLSMVANNQFLTKDAKGNIVDKPVRYHLFDKFHTNEYKGKRRDEYRYRYRYDFFADGKIKVEQNEYLPLPLFPSAEDYHFLDKDDPALYDDIEKTLSFGEASLNYIIVSLGSDYLSIDMANKIAARLSERDVGNTHIFVRIREEKVYNSNKILLDSDMCVPFGSAVRVVYDYSHIISEKFAEMAIARNFIYDIEHDMKHSVVTDAEARNSRLKWYSKLTDIGRESNVYACLGLREKLHLMGLDYCKADETDSKGLTEQEYFKHYAAGDMPDFACDQNGHAVSVRYSLEYKPSRRKNLAMQEHNRWNAFMITKGFAPASKDQILNELDADGKHTNGKNYEMRRHGNLTPFDGLVEFRKLLAARDNVSEEQYDVIKYDYQLLDGAWWLLDKNGFKITERRG